MQVTDDHHAIFLHATLLNFHASNFYFLCYLTPSHKFDRDKCLSFQAWTLDLNFGGGNAFVKKSTL